MMSAPALGSLVPFSALEEWCTGVMPAGTHMHEAW